MNPNEQTDRDLLPPPLPSVDDVFGVVRGARSVDPALLDSYESMEDYRERIKGYTRASRTPEAPAFIQTGYIANTMSPGDVLKIQRSQEIALTISSNPEAGPLHGEYMEFGYSYEDAYTFVTSGIPPSYVSGVWNGTLQKEIQAERVKQAGTKASWEAS